jgi:hypothetical protein
LEQAAFFGYVTFKPFLRQRLRKFKHFFCNSPLVPTLFAARLDFQTQSSDSIPKFGILAGERRFVDLIRESEIEQAVLLLS